MAFLNSFSFMHIK